MHRHKKKKIIKKNHQLEDIISPVGIRCLAPFGNEVQGKTRSVIILDRFSKANCRMENVAVPAWTQSKSLAHTCVHARTHARRYERFEAHVLESNRQPPAIETRPALAGLRAAQQLGEPRPY